MRVPTLASLGLSFVCLTFGGSTGCESGPAPAPGPQSEQSLGPDPPPALPLDRFSATRAFADLEALTAIGPRVSGSEGAERARAYLREQLAAADLEVEVIETPRPPSEEAAQTDAAPPASATSPLRHLSVTLPGASPDLFVLIAPYDTSRLAGIDYAGANDTASGAALLLELGRVLSTRTLPYTTRLLFVDGDGRVETPDGERVAPRWRGAASLAAAMDRSGELDGVRLLLAFHQVGDTDLRIARDLASHRMYREELFRAADRLSRTGPFPRDEGFESVEAGHLAFGARGVRGVVAVTDTRYGGDVSPGLYAESAQDTPAHCSPDSLEAVGLVVLEALDTIGRRLAKIDRFTRSPVAAVDALDEEPVEQEEPPSEAPATGSGSPQTNGAGGAAPRPSDATVDDPWLRPSDATVDDPWLRPPEAPVAPNGESR